jgi:hypothetical protein
VAVDVGQWRRIMSYSTSPDYALRTSTVVGAGLHAKRQGRPTPSSPLRISPS